MTEDGLFVCKDLRMDANIWSDEWGDQEEDWSGGGGRHKRLPRASERPGLGATVGELDPGNFVVYHFHHAWEELLIVLSGRPTLHTPAGERLLEEGESVFFPSAPTARTGCATTRTGPSAI
jgi:quercetin dioxygenase-like cupin family protein